MEHQICLNMIADTDTNKLSFSSRQKQAKTSKKYSLDYQPMLRWKVKDYHKLMFWLILAMSYPMSKKN